MAHILHGRKLNSIIEMTTLGEFIFNQADKFGSNICQIDANLRKTESYSSVKQRSVRLAVSLQNKLSAGDVTVSCSKNTLDNAIPVLASFYLGAVVSNLDASLGVKNSRYLMSLVSPKIIFVDEASVAMIEEALQGTDLEPEIVVFGRSDKYRKFSDLVQPSPEEASFRPVTVDVHDTAVMFFSSGTSGFPKAVCHSHYTTLQIVEIGKKIEFEEPCTLNFSKFYWISAMILLIRGFVDGSTRVFSESLDADAILRTIQDYKVSSVFGAPSLTYVFTHADNLQQYDISSFRYMLITGTGFSSEQYKRFSDLLPNVDIIFAYAMTEIGQISLFNPKYHKELMKSKPKSCGKVAPETSLKIVSTDTREILGPNQKGEIHVKSPGLMVGYYNLGSTSQCLDNDGFLKTGDMGYYDDDNCLYVVGRLKEMFKYKSWHIVPSFMEDVILEHPAVKEAVVVGVPQEDEGEVPTACVVLKDGYVASSQEIEMFVAERVSEREKLRGGVTFTTELPKTPTGKVIRREVQKNLLRCLE